MESISVSSPLPRNLRTLKDRFKLEGLVQNALSSTRSNTNNSESYMAQSIIMEKHCRKPLNTGRFEDYYQLKQTIGQGANAYVMKCLCLNDGQLYAVKVSEVEEEHLLYLRKLFNKLTKLSHPSILTYREMFINLKMRTCHLVMDLVDHPNLSDCIYRLREPQRPLTQLEIKEIMRQLFDVLEFLHSNKICHRDVKPANILYQRVSGKIWLIDYGVSKIMVERNVLKEMMTNTGTCDYKAPEIFEGGKYNQSIDLWAAGIVLYELVQKHLPFSHQYLSTTIANIVDINYEEGSSWLTMSRYARDLLHRLLRPAVHRLSAEEALRSLWFNRNDVVQPLMAANSLSVQTRLKYWNGEKLELLAPPLTPMLSFDKEITRPRKDSILWTQQKNGIAGVGGKNLKLLQQSEYGKKCTKIDQSV